MSENLNPEMIEASVTIENPPSDTENSQNEAGGSVTRTWEETEKPKVNKRQSLLQRMRSSRSKEKEENSSSDEEEEPSFDENEPEMNDNAPEMEDDIKPLEDSKKRKRKKAAEVVKKPSFQKQTSR